MYSFDKTRFYVNACGCLFIVEGYPVDKKEVSKEHYKHIVRSLNGISK
jgi:hypothetical protein